MRINKKELASLIKTVIIKEAAGAKYSATGPATEADLNNPMIANLFSPYELEQLRANMEAGGAPASRAADDISSKLSDAAESMRDLASRFGLLEQKLIKQLVREEVKKLLK